MENPFEIIIEQLNTIEKRIEAVELSLNFKNESQTYSDVMSLNQLCEFYDFTKSYIYKQTANREIPYYKKGKRLLFKRTEIDGWLLKNKVRTMDDLQREATKYSLKRLK